MKVLGVDAVYNHADYRLMSRRALEALSEYREVNLFLRGIVPLIGTAATTFIMTGMSGLRANQIPAEKMISLCAGRHHLIQREAAEDDLKPRHPGVAAEIIGLLYALISHFCGVTVAGWTAIVSSIWLLGASSCCALGWSAAISERSTARSRPSALPHRNPGGARQSAGRPGKPAGR